MCSVDSLCREKKKLSFCRGLVYTDTTFITVLSLFSTGLIKPIFPHISHQHLCLFVVLFLISLILFPRSVLPQKERKAGGLLKLLSGAAAKKKPRSPPSSPPTHDPSLAGQGAVATDPAHHPHHHHHHARSGSCPMASQGRAGSCPIESEMAGAIGLEPLHRKSGSLDTNFPRSPPATRAGNALMVLRPEPKPLSRERWARTHIHTERHMHMY